MTTIKEIDRTKDLIFCRHCGKFSRNTFEFFDERFQKPRNKIEQSMAKMQTQCPHCYSISVLNASQLLTLGANLQMKNQAPNWLYYKIYQLVLHALWDQYFRLKQKPLNTTADNIGV